MEESKLDGHVKASYEVLIGTTIDGSTANARTEFRKQISPVVRRVRLSLMLRSYDVR